MLFIRDKCVCVCVFLVPIGGESIHYYCYYLFVYFLSLSLTLRVCFALCAGIRTFGVHRRRMQMMLPIMYKLGVITTLLFGLTVLSVKGVTIGLILLMLAVTGIVTKVSTRQSQHHYAPPWSAAIHDVYDRSSSSPQSQQPYAAQHEKSIHVHVHAALPGATVVRDADDVGDDAQHYWNGAVGDYRRRYYGDDGAHYYRGPGSDAVAFDTSSTNSAYRRWLG